MHTHTHTHTVTRTHTHPCIHTHAPTHAPTHTRTHTRTCAGTALLALALRRRRPPSSSSLPLLPPRRRRPGRARAPRRQRRAEPRGQAVPVRRARPIVHRGGTNPSAPAPSRLPPSLAALLLRPPCGPGCDPADPACLAGHWPGRTQLGQQGTRGLVPLSAVLLIGGQAQQHRDVGGDGVAGLGGWGGGFVLGF